MKTELFLCFSMLLIISCHSNNTNSKKVDHNENSKEIQRVYELRKNKATELLFLDFWIDMNRNDFDIVKDSLLKTKKLSRHDNRIVYYLNTVHIDPKDSKKYNSEIVFELSQNFKNNKLTNINLEYLGLRWIKNQIRNDIVNIDGKSTLTQSYNDIIDLFITKYGNPSIEDFIPLRNIKRYEWITTNKIIRIDLTINPVVNNKFPKDNLSVDNCLIHFSSKKDFLEMEKQKNRNLQQNNEEIESKKRKTLNDI